jgi:hypothetical protein
MFPRRPLSWASDFYFARACRTNLLPIFADAAHSAIGIFRSHWGDFRSFPSCRITDQFDIFLS